VTYAAEHAPGAPAVRELSREPPATLRGVPIICFDEASKQRLACHFVGARAPGGYRCLGHSESLLQGVDGLAPCGRTSYRKRA
jgi:chemotaxis methyl-accepting protein methylase